MKSYSKSNELLARGLKVTPLAAQTFSKCYRYFCKGNAPSYIDHGEGCYLYDVDGNVFIDFICALGPITVGYNNKTINDAVIEQLKKGTSFSLQAPVEVTLAEKICTIIPCAEMVRFVKNGGDATTASIRLARAYTKKDMVLMCGYHGMHDWSIGATVNHKGVPLAVRELTHTFKYNDLSDVESKLEQYKDKVAAVILEPIQGNGPAEGYLSELKNLVHKHNAILIFDEVVSGFRYALGGASELYNIVPDMMAFGKGMANGYAISAIAGKKELLSQIEEGVFISTTFGGDALSMAAALATISILEKPGFYEYIWKLGTMMKEGVSALISKHKLEKVVSVVGLAPHCGVAFEDSGKLSYLDINSIYSQELVTSNILAHTICNLNSSHTEKEIDTYLKATDRAFALIRKAIDKGSVEGILIGERIDPVFKRN